MNIRKKPEKQYGNQLMGSSVGVPSSSRTYPKWRTADM